MPLPDRHFRTLDQIPQIVIQEFAKAEGGILTPEKVQQLRLIDRFFRKWDKSQDDFIDLEEFRIRYKPRFVSISAEQRRQIEEKTKKLLPARKGTSGARTRLLDKFDIDNDGVLSEEEEKNRVNFLVSNRFSRIDTNSDQNISLSEFVMWQRTHAFSLKRRDFQSSY